MSFSKQKLVVAGSEPLQNPTNCFEIGGKSLSLLVHTPLSWGRRVSLKRHSSQANIILEIYSVDLHLGCFPRGGVLAKPALFEGIGTAEYLYFSHFHCMAGHIFLILCNLLILS